MENKHVVMMKANSEGSIKSKEINTKKIFEKTDSEKFYHQRYWTPFKFPMDIIFQLWQTPTSNCLWKYWKG